MKSRILIIPVNYNSYDHLMLFLNSIDNSLKMACDYEIDLSVYIADNSSNKVFLDFSSYKDFEIKLYSFENLGYLGGAFAVIKSINDVSVFDYIIISNVDLLLDKYFFSTLLSINLSDQLGWLVPSIFSEVEKRDRNPKVITRYSKLRLLMLFYMYKYPLLHCLYQKTLYKRKYIDKQYKQMDVYAGHGSFMIFTKAFFLKKPKLQYPVFLFGEEIYFAELMRSYSLKVTYIPRLKVFDKEHISISKMKSDFYYKCNREAIKYLISTFYE